MTVTVDQTYSDKPTMFRPELIARGAVISMIEQ